MTNLAIIVIALFALLAIVIPLVAWSLFFNHPSEDA